MNAFESYFSAFNDVDSSLKFHLLGHPITMNKEEIGRLYFPERRLCYFHI